MSEPRRFDPGCIRSRVAAHRPVLAAPGSGATPAAAEAAVAILLHAHGPSGPELLFIERAAREGDAWSGHIAFPGGRRCAGDVDLEATAVRETREELGVVLGPAMGRLDDYDARTASRRRWELVVASFVFEVERRPAVELNHEVADVLWVPLATVLDPAAASRHSWQGAGIDVSLPAVRLDHRVLWGMTYRIVAGLLGVLGERLPGMEWDSG